METRALLDEELLAQLKDIQIRAKHLVNASFAGEYESAFKGRGMEFDEVREYMPGDDVRTIDWNVTARSQSPYVKIFRDERELTVMFAVDVSASSQFGTVKKFKSEIAAEISALLAYTAMKNNDKVGLLIFSDKIEHYVPPKKGRAHVWRIIRDILTFKADVRKTDLNIPLEFLGRVIKHRSIVFLLSDFQDKNFDHQMKVSSKKHDYIAVSISDPKELSLPNLGYLELEDAETGEYILVDTSDQYFLSNYTKDGERKLKAEKEYFQSIGVDHIPVSTGESYVRPIVAFFKQRFNRAK